jgi:CRP-like cAMP-binding protein
MACGTVHRMLQIPVLIDHATTLTLRRGAVVLRRGQAPGQVVHLDRGRVVLGLLDQGGLHHQLGVIEGPFWLEPASALLGLGPLVDAVADTEVRLQTVAPGPFQAQLDDVPEPARSMLIDLARAQRRQTEMAISRLAKDADVRCAEWLIRHAQIDPAHQGMRVNLLERKRSIAAQLGIAPETFSRILRQLRDRGLISGRGRVLQLINPEALQALAAR